MKNLSFPPQYDLINSPLILAAALRNQNNYPLNMFASSQMQLMIQCERWNYLQLCQMEHRLQTQNSQQKLLNEMGIPVNYLQNSNINTIDAPQNLLFLEPELRFNHHSSYHSECPSTKSISPYQPSQSDLVNVKAQISNMVEYFVTRFGKDKPEEANRQRMFYMTNEQLLKVFDMIAKRYSSTGKCREDMSRFAMRKALTFLRDQERKTSDSNVRDSSLAMCQKYLSPQPGSSDQEILDELLPYKKNSKNKTPNCDFAAQIFSSENFCADYQLYLAQFDHLMEADNKKKIKKFVEFLVSCVENDNIDKINTYKRLPWLNVWIESTKIVADELLAKNSKNGPQRMSIQEEDVKKKKRGRVSH